MVGAGRVRSGTIVIAEALPRCSGGGAPAGAARRAPEGGYRPDRGVGRPLAARTAGWRGRSCQGSAVRVSVPRPPSSRQSAPKAVRGAHGALRLRRAGWWLGSRAWRVGGCSCCGTGRRSGRGPVEHTGRTDVPLTERGRELATAAGQLGRRLRGDRSARPGADQPPPPGPGHRRAGRAARRPGRRAARRVGLRRLRGPDHPADPGEHGAGLDGVDASVPGRGDAPAQVGARADAVLAEARAALPDGDVVLVGHGHFSRVLIARWIGRPATEGVHFAMDRRLGGAGRGARGAAAGPDQPAPAPGAVDDRP